MFEYIHQYNNNNIVCTKIMEKKYGQTTIFGVDHFSCGDVSVTPGGLSVVAKPNQLPDAVEKYVFTPYVFINNCIIVGKYNHIDGNFSTYIYFSHHVVKLLYLFYQM